jgi:hypothetical protein
LQKDFPFDLKKMLWFNNEPFKKIISLTMINIKQSFLIKCEFFKQKIDFYGNIPANKLPVF